MIVYSWMNIQIKLDKLIVLSVIILTSPLFVFMLLFAIFFVLNFINIMAVVIVTFVKNIIYDIFVIICDLYSIKFRIGIIILITFIIAFNIHSVPIFLFMWCYVCNYSSFSLLISYAYELL